MYYIKKKKYEPRGGGEANAPFGLPLKYAPAVVCTHDLAPKIVRLSPVRLVRTNRTLLSYGHCAQGRVTLIATINRVSWIFP
jgi:hypothetical protein